ncbi:hypothetical protein [Puniceibacterium antarcticum]|nr:hypothetical protein [Puniceibacterium antarcticum]
MTAAFGLDGALAITASSDRTARLWRVADATCVATIPFDAALTAMAVDRTMIAFGDALGGVHLFDFSISKD